MASQSVNRHRLLTHHRHPILTRSSMMYCIDCEVINLEICGSFFDAGYSLKWVIFACRSTHFTQTSNPPRLKMQMFCNHRFAISLSCARVSLDASPHPQDRISSYARRVIDITIGCDSARIGDKTTGSMRENADELRENEQDVDREFLLTEYIVHRIDSWILVLTYRGVR